MLNRLFTNKLSISLFKWLVVLFLINLFVVDPAIKGLTKAINGIGDKAIVKIIALDLISNPLTFIQLASNALENNKTENAHLYISYAEVLASRYNYPPSVRIQILKIKEKLQQQKSS
jgi:hypothetical protein